MIVYVDLEHDRLRQSPVQWEQSLARRLKHKYRIDAMRPASTAPAHDGPNPFPESGYKPGLKEEHGFMPVRVLAPHGLLEGLGAQPVLYESHYWEVKSPPDGFRVYAESSLCAIQIMAPLGEAKPLFGTQFHPEEYDEAHPDGRRLLVNFFRMAGLAAA